MKKNNNTLGKLKGFLILWSTQSLSSLGSAMTNYALIVRAYQTTGSALSTALLSFCSYTPYVLFSLFAGAIGNKWNKKAVMLVCDTCAALCTVLVALLLHAGRLEIGTLYALNAVNGLMNTFQQPASEVAVTLLTPREYYQRTSGMRAFSNSLIGVLTPILATAMLSFLGIGTVIAFDLATFSVAFFSLLLFVRLPAANDGQDAEGVFQTLKAGLGYLKNNRGIFDLIAFLAAINFTASAFNAALPALLLPIESDVPNAYGIVNMVSGLAMLAGSILVSILPAPKSRTRAICNALLLSMSTENFFLAFGKTLPVWCIGAVLGWLAIPVMNANTDTLFRNYIPLSMQGRVYSARNTFQFFTIPLGYVAGGALVDLVFEPFMSSRSSSSVFVRLFGAGKGAGAACFLFVLGILGILTCLIFRKDPAIRALEENTEK